jgi:hypothetical protein
MIENLKYNCQTSASLTQRLKTIGFSLGSYKIEEIKITK